MDVDLHHPHHLTHNHQQHHLQQQHHTNQHSSQHQLQQRQQHQTGMNPSISASTSSPNANNSTLATGTGATSAGVMSASGATAMTGGPQIRSRITVVCAECKRLKLKCDRRSPCGSCLKRDTVVRCIYSPAAAEKVDLHSLNNRLIQVESILAMLTSGQHPPAPFQSAYPYPYPNSTPIVNAGVGPGTSSAGGDNSHAIPSTNAGGGIPLLLPGAHPANLGSGANGNAGSSESMTDGSWGGRYALNMNSNTCSASDYPSANGGHTHGPQHQHHEHHHHYAAPMMQKDEKLGMVPEDVARIWLDDLDRGVAKEWLGDALAVGGSSGGHGAANVTTNANATGTNVRKTTQQNVNEFEYALDGPTSSANTIPNPAGYIKLEPSPVDIAFQYSYPNPYPPPASSSVTTATFSPPQRSAHHNMVIDLDATDVDTSNPATFASTSKAHITSTPRHQQHILLPALSIYYPLPSISPPGTSPSSSAAFPPAHGSASFPPSSSIPPHPQPCPPSPASHPTLSLSPSTVGGNSLTSTSGGYVFPPFSTSLSGNGVMQQHVQSPFHQPFAANANTNQPGNATSTTTAKIKTKPQITPALLSLLPPVERCKTLLKDARRVVLGVRCVPLGPIRVGGAEFGRGEVDDVDVGKEKGASGEEGYGKMWDAFERRCVSLLSRSPSNGVFGGDLSPEQDRERARERERERERARERVREKDRRQKAREARKARQIYFGGILTGTSAVQGQRGQRMEIEGADDEEELQDKGDSHEEEMETVAHKSVSMQEAEEDRLSEEDLEGYFDDERDRDREAGQNASESLAFFATMCAVLAIGTSVSTRDSAPQSTSNSSPSSSSKSPSAISPPAYHTTSPQGPNSSPAFLYALSQQALDVWDANSRPDADADAILGLEVLLNQRTEYVLGCVVGMVYLLLRMSGSGFPVEYMNTSIDDSGLEEGEKGKEKENEKEKECIRVLMNKMVSAARDAGLESNLHDASSPFASSTGKKGAFFNPSTAKPRTSAKPSASTAGGAKKRGPISNAKGKTLNAKGKKSKLTWEREREQERSATAVAIVNAQEEWRRMVLWEVMFYDLFTADMLGHEPYVPSSIYASLKLPGCSSSPLSGDDDEYDEDQGHENEVDDEQATTTTRLDVDGRIYAYLCARYRLTRISNLVKTRLANPECCCGYTFDQASKLEEEIAEWNEWSSRNLGLSLTSSSHIEDDAADDNDEYDSALQSQRAELTIWANTLVVKIYTPFLRHAASSSSSNASSSSTSHRARQAVVHPPPASVGPALTAAYQTTARAAQAIVRAAQCVMKPVHHGRQGRRPGRIADSEVQVGERSSSGVGAASDVPMDMGVDMFPSFPLDVDMELELGVGVASGAGDDDDENQTIVDVDVGPDADRSFRQAAVSAITQARGMEGDRQSPRNPDSVAHQNALQTQKQVRLAKSAPGPTRENLRKNPTSHVSPSFFDFYPLEKVVFDAVVICAHSGLELAPRPVSGRSLTPSLLSSSVYSSIDFDNSSATAKGQPKPQSILVRLVLDDLDTGLNILSDLCGPPLTVSGRGNGGDWGWGWGRCVVSEAQKRVMEVLYTRAGALRASGDVAARPQRSGRKVHTNANALSPTLISDNIANVLKRKHGQISSASPLTRPFADERSVPYGPHQHPPFAEITLSPAIPSTQHQTNNPYPFGRTITIPDASSHNVTAPANITTTSPPLPNSPNSAPSPSHPVVINNFPQDVMQRNERQKLELTSALTSVATARLSAAASAAKERDIKIKGKGRERERLALDDSAHNSGSENEKEKERKHPRKSLGGSRPLVGVRMRQGLADDMGGMHAHPRVRGGSVSMIVGGNAGGNPLPLMTSKPRPFPSSVLGPAMDSANAVLTFAQKHKNQVHQQSQQSQHQVLGLGGVVLLSAENDESHVGHRSRSSSFVRPQVSDQQLQIQQYQQPQHPHPLSYDSKPHSDDISQRNKYDISTSVPQQQQQNQVSPVHPPFAPRSVFDHTHNVHNNVLYDQPPSSGPVPQSNSSFSPYDGTAPSSGDAVAYTGNALPSSPFSTGGNANGPPSSSGSPFTASSVSSSSGGGGPAHPSTPTFTSPPLFRPPSHPPPTATANTSAAASPVVGYYHPQGAPFDHHRESSLSRLEPQQHSSHHHQPQHHQQTGHSHEHGQISLGVEVGMNQNTISLSDNTPVIYDKNSHQHHHSQMYDVKPQRVNHMHFLQHTQDRQAPSHLHQQDPHQQQPQHHHHLAMGHPAPSSHTGYEGEAMEISGQSQPMSLGMAVSSAWPTSGGGGGGGQEQQPQAQDVQQNNQSFWGNDPGFRFYA